MVHTVAVLADTIVALGAQPPFASCGFNFDAALSDVSRWLSMLGPPAAALDCAGLS